VHGNSFSAKRNVFTVAFEMIFVISAGNRGKREETSDDRKNSMLENGLRSEWKKVL
jgi:hypothetical protein